MRKFKKGDKIILEAVVTGVYDDGSYQIEIVGDTDGGYVDVAAGIIDHAALSAGVIRLPPQGG